LEGYPAIPLWTNFEQYLSQDHITAHQSHEHGLDHSLQSISDFLVDCGRSLSDFGLQFRTAEVVAELESYANCLLELQQTTDLMYEQMNAEQTHIYGLILYAILDHLSHIHALSSLKEHLATEKHSS
jgi:hypothetical protein